MFGKKENKKRSEKIINYYDMLEEGETAWHWMKCNMEDRSILFCQEYSEQPKHGFPDSKHTCTSVMALKLRLHETVVGLKGKLSQFISEVKYCHLEAVRMYVFSRTSA